MAIRSVLAPLAAFSLLALPAAAAPPIADRTPNDASPIQIRLDGHRLVRALADTPEKLALLLDLASDVWSHQVAPGPLDVLIPPDRWDEFLNSGLEHVILQEDVQSLIDAERSRLAAARDEAGALRGQPEGLAWFADYKTYDDVNAYLDALVALRPDLVSRVVIGQSLQGRDIVGVRISGPGEGKPTVVLNGCQHAREWVAVMTPMFILDRFVREYDADKRIRAAVDGVEWFILPIINPDGYDYTWTNQRLWRKNRRPNSGGTFGVDLNRNWSVGWGGNDGSSGSGSSETYRGTMAFSEPETLALGGFMFDLESLAAHIDFHSYSQVVLSPWGHTSAAAPDADALNAIGAEMAQIATSTNGAIYDSGPASTTLYIASGVVTDWVYGDRGKFAWAIELRDTGASGFLLPPAQIIPTGEEMLPAMLHLSESILAPVRFETGEPPIVLPAGAPYEVSIDIDADFGASLDESTLALFHRVGPAGPFTETPLTLSRGADENTYTATIPGAPCGQTVQWWFRAAAVGRPIETWPPEAPNTLIEAAAAQIDTIFADDFESESGWTAGAPGDTATTGIWLRANPVGTSAQPEDDHSAEGIECFVTGNGQPGGAVGSADVDNGFTTLISPTLDCLTTGDPYIVYHRWFSTVQSSDALTVSISNDDGQNWTTVETVNTNQASWKRHVFRIADLLQPTSTMRLRFVAADNNPQSIVEAAIDDLEILSLECAQASIFDLDGDGAIGSGDLALLLGAWGPCPPAPADCIADFDADGAVTAGDLALMLGAWG